MTTILDIINRHRPACPAPSTGATSPIAPVSSLPAGTESQILSRFRSVAHQMSAVADASLNSEIDRILALPIMRDFTPEEIEIVSRWYFPDGEITLWYEQAKAIVEFNDYGSIWGPIGVGRGKELISILVTNDAYTKFGKKKIILLNPSHLIPQLHETELPKFRKHTSINVPYHWLTFETRARRMMMANSGRPGCYVLSYDLLSSKDGAEIFHAIQPDMIIGNEVHRILSNQSARGRRFREIVKTYNPNLVSLSGSMTKRSPVEYHSIAVHTLQERCFIPRPQMQNENIAKIIDSTAQSLDQLDTFQQQNMALCLKWVNWHNSNFPEEKVSCDLVGIREAFKKRMQTAPGVVASKGKDEFGVSLRISNVPITMAEKEASPGWDRLTELVDKLVNLWIAPNGDEIEFAMHIWRYRYELEGIGGYNDLSWPIVEKVAERRKVSLSEAEDLLERSRYHHTLHQEYAKVLRHWLGQRAKTGMDTPMLVGNEMFRNGAKNVGDELYQAWLAVREANFDGIIERDGKFVRVCDFRIKKIVEWAKAIHEEDKSRAALVWFGNDGVGKWLRDYFKEADLPYLYCPAGKEGLAKISDESKRDHFTLATYNAFNEGLNIQRIHSKMFYSQWSRQAKLTQQSLGRLHRPGQPDDEVRVYGSFCSEFDDVLLAACLNDAAYCHQTNNEQKLIYADWDFRPKVLPYAVLVQWGADPEGSTQESRKILEDKFDGE